MSRTIDNRVVEMQFKNQQFETAANKTINTLKELNNSINILEGTKALKSLDTSVKTLDFTPANDGIRTLTDRFSTLGIIGASVINTITSAITVNLMNAVSKVSSTITGLYSDIVTRGYNRALALQQAKFSFQGLISTSGEGLDELQTAQRIEDIMAAVNRSVADTPYSLAEAASAASVLAAAYGTSTESIVKMESTLKTISGLAAQTGAEYSQVSNVMTNIAASGVAMGQEIDSMQRWGLGVKTYLKNYINSSGQLTKAANEVLTTKNNKRSTYQTITEADVKQLASKAFITSDMINEVFGSFFDNAQKANDTLKGVTDNIGAALGRLGAMFIEPIIENQGPYVVFLQNVKSKISEIANALKEFKVDENFVGIVTKILEKGTELLKALNVSDLSIFERIGNLVETINEGMEVMTPDAFSTYGDVYSRTMDRFREEFGPLKKYKDFVNDIAAEMSGVAGMNYDILKELEQQGNATFGNGVTPADIYAEAQRRVTEQAQNYAAAEQEAADSAGRMYENISKTAEFWQYDYFGSITDAITNFKDAFIEIGSVIGDVIGENAPELKKFIDVLTGARQDKTGLRGIINSLAEGIKSISERFKKFVTENESFRSFLKGIGSAFTLIWRVLKMLKTIAENSFNSFKPLFERFGTLFGFLGDFLGSLVDIDNETDAFGTTANIVSTIIDKFAGILTTVYDGIGNFILSLSGKEDISSFFSGLVDKIRGFVEDIGPVFDTIKETIGNFFDFLSGKAETFQVPDIIGAIKSLFSSRTKGREDISAGDVTEDLENVSIDMEQATEVIEGVTEQADPMGNALMALIDKFDKDSLMGRAIEALTVTFIDGLNIDVTLNRLKLVADIISELMIAFGVMFAAISGPSNIKKVSKLIQNGAFFNQIANALNIVTATGSQVNAGIKRWRRANELEAIADIIKSIGIVIGAIAASVFVLVISLRMLASIKTSALIKGGIALGVIMLLIAGMVVLIALFAKKLAHDTTARTGFQIGKNVHGSVTNSPAAKIITSLSAFIFVFAIACGILAQAMIAMSKVGSEDLERGMGAMFIIGFIIIAIVGVLAFIIYKFLGKFDDSLKNEGLFKKNKLSSLIDSISVLLSAIAVTINKLADAVILLAQTPDMTKGLDALVKISTIIAILMAEIMIFIYLVLDAERFGSDTQDILKPLIGVAILLGVLAGVMYVMALAVEKMSAAAPNNLKQATEALITIAVIIGIMVIVAAVLSKLFATDIDKLILVAISIAILGGALALVCAGIGVMVEAFGKSGFSAKEVESIITTIAIVIGVVLVIAGILAVIAGDMPLILVGILLVALLVAAIGFAAAGIGAGVMMIGAGVLMFATAVKMLIDTFKLLDKSQVKNIVKSVKYFVEALPEVIMAGFKAFFKVIKKNKDTIIDGIIELVALIFEALTAWIPGAFKGFLETLSSLLDVALEWVIENGERLGDFILRVAGIIYNILGGDDGSSGVIGMLIGLIIGALESLFIGGEESDGLIDYTIKMMLAWCYAIEEHSHELADAFYKAVIAVINSTADAIDNNHQDLLDAIDRLTEAVIGALMDFFGVDPSTGENKQTIDMIKGFVKSMFLPSLWLITPYAREQLNLFKDSLADTLSNIFMHAFYYGTNPIIHWLIKGMIKKLQPAADEGSIVAGTILQAIKAGLGEHSPSKPAMQMGEYIVEGLVIGMKSGKGYLTSVSKKTGEIALSPLQRIKQQVKLFFSDIFDGSDMDSFSITPTLDLTQITEDFGSLEGMMNDTSSFDISSLTGEGGALSSIDVGSLTDSEGAIEVAEGFDNTKIGEMTKEITPSTDNIINFTQNNYSPESLSRIDIYRDTKNMLSSPNLSNLFST